MEFEADDNFNYSALRILILRKDFNEAREFINDHPECINQKFVTGETPLHLAIEKYDIEMVKFLLHFGADINIENILQQNALVLSLQVFNEVPYHEKQMCDNIQIIIKMIIEHGSSARNVILSTFYKFCGAIHIDDTQQILQILRKIDNVSNLFHPQLSPIVMATIMNKKSMIQFLLNLGFNINDDQPQRESALGYAMKNKNVQVTKLLLESGSSPNRPILDFETGTNISPILFALEIYSTDKCVGLELLQLLIRYGAGITEKSSNDNSGKTNIHEAAIYECNEGIQIFKVKQGDVNILDGRGNTPLHYAVKNSDTALLLMKLGADVNRKNSKGETPLHLAIEENNFASIKALIVYQSNIDALNDNGNSTLHYAAANFGKNDIFKFIIQRIQSDKFGS